MNVDRIKQGTGQRRGFVLRRHTQKHKAVFFQAKDLKGIFSSSFSTCKGQSNAENVTKDTLTRKQLVDGQFDAGNFWLWTGQTLGVGRLGAV